MTFCDSRVNGRCFHTVMLLLVYQESLSSSTLVLDRPVERTWLCVVAACLPEGVRLLSVFLSADEYRDLIQCCGSSDQSTVKPSDPGQESGSERRIVRADSRSEHATVSDVDIYHRGSVMSESCKQTDGKDIAGVFASNDTESLTRHRGQHSSHTEDAAAICRSSAISGMCVVS